MQYALRRPKNGFEIFRKSENQTFAPRSHGLHRSRVSIVAGDSGSKAVNITRSMFLRLSSPEIPSRNLPRGKNPVLRTRWYVYRGGLETKMHTVPKSQFFIIFESCKSSDRFISFKFYRMCINTCLDMLWFSYKLKIVRER